MTKGYLALVLHAHLPYVRHPEHDDFLEERWFYEAMAESYLPLYEKFERLAGEGVEYRLTISFSPTLILMMNDQLLKSRFGRYLDRLQELGEKEVQRTGDNPDINHLARMYLDRVVSLKMTYHERLKGDLIGGYRSLQDRGYLEVITSAATHGYLPLLGIREKAAAAQISVGASLYRRFFGRTPPGMWLPECGYTPGIDRYLVREGIQYVILENHGVNYASPRPRYGPYSPIRTAHGLKVFGRDPESSKQVWSAQEGYPGDFDYRDFYRDIGFDLEYDYISPYLNKDGIRVATGFKYHRITGKTDHKELYSPEKAEEKAAVHAGNFMFNREKQVEHLAGIMDRPPVVVAPYDCELFGHWWFEGPTWLYYLLKKIHYDQNTVKTTTPGAFLREHAHLRIQPSEPIMSSWGYRGYNDVWLDGSNHWVYRHLGMAQEKMEELARTFPHPDDLQRRALDQAARELLLAQSSDWPFIMKTGTTVPYAERRIVSHLNRFWKISGDLLSGRLDPGEISYYEDLDNPFPKLDYRIYA